MLYLLLALLHYHTEIPKVEDRWVEVGEGISEYKPVALPLPDPEWKQRLLKDFQEQKDKEDLKELIKEAKERTRAEQYWYRNHPIPK